MHRCSVCEWIPILPRPVWPLAGQCRLGQNRVVGSMVCLLLWHCWAACQERVCQDPISIPTEPHHGLVESYPVRRRGGKTALFLREGCSISPVEDHTLSTSPNMDKSP